MQIPSSACFLSQQKHVQTMSSANAASSKNSKHEIRVLQDELMTVKIREAQSLSDLKEMKQKVMELETQVKTWTETLNEYKSICIHLFPNPTVPSPSGSTREMQSYELCSNFSLLLDNVRFVSHKRFSSVFNSFLSFTLFPLNFFFCYYLFCRI